MSDIYARSRTKGKGIRNQGTQPWKCPFQGQHSKSQNLMIHRQCIFRAEQNLVEDRYELESVSLCRALPQAWHCYCRAALRLLAFQSIFPLLRDPCGAVDACKVALVLAKQQAWLTREDELEIEMGHQVWCYCFLVSCCF